MPNVFLIGDSISIGYTPEVTRVLAGKATVARNPGNAMYSAWGLRHLRDWLGTTKWDVIHFNWGIWDLHHLKPGADPLEPSVSSLMAGGIRRTTPGQYAANLEANVQILKTTGAKLIWATITPLQDRGNLCAKPEEVPLYNSIATPIMNAHSIAINDLHAAVRPDLLDPDGCHLNENGYRHLGRQVAMTIEGAL